MERKANFIIVGLFAFIGTLALAYFAYWLGKYGVQNRPFNYYETELSESVSGLKESSPVKLQGIDVGMIESVVLDPTDPQKVHISFKVFKNTPVKTDTLVRLNTQGIAGTAYLELKGGTKESALLSGTANRRTFIASERSSLSNLLAKADTLMSSVDLTLKKVQGTLSDRNMEHFSSMLENGSKFSSTLDRHGDELSALMSKTTALEENASLTLTSINETNAKAQSLIESVKATSDTTHAMVQDMNRSDLIGKLSNVLDNTNQTVTSANETVNETKAFVQELRKSPSSLLFK